MYTLLYLEWITNKDLLYSTGNSAQYSGITYRVKDSEKINMCISETESLCYTPETNTTVLITCVNVCVRPIVSDSLQPRGL